MECEVCGVNFGIEKLEKPNSKFNGIYMCQKHRNCIKNNGWINDKKPPKTPMELRVCDYCESKGSEQKIFCRDGKYLCQKHYNQMYLYGKILKRTVRDRNEIIYKDGYAEIVLYNFEHNEIARTLIDTDDVELVLNYKWNFDLRHNYATTRVKQKHLGLHQLIMDTKKLGHSVVVDHINRDGLDNRRSNLRVANKSVNAINSGLRINNKSGVTGVSFSNVHNLWRSYINFEGKRVELGRYKQERDAVVARLEAESRYYSEHPPQKHLFKQYNIKEVG